MNKAIAAHELGDAKKKQMHLDNAKTARYAMKSTDIAKHKDLLDKYSQMREEVEQIEELNKSTLASYAKKSAAELPKHQANSTLKHTGPIANAHAGKHPKTGESPVQWDDRKVMNRA